MAIAHKICLFSGLRSSLLRPHHDVRAGMDLYKRYTGFSPASKGLAMLSQSNIGPAVARSAGPASPPLLHWDPQKLSYGILSVGVT